MKILLVSHQLDYSGAPIALLQLAKALLCLGHSVTIASLETGPLLSEFDRCGVRQFDYWYSDASDYDLIVANTIISVPASLDFAKNVRPIVAWIHESKFFFEVLGATPQMFRLDELHLAVFPSKFQTEEFVDLMPNALLGQLKNCVEIPLDISAQEFEEPYLVCSGRWEPRKAHLKLVNLLKVIEDPPQVHFVGADRPSYNLSGNFIFTGLVMPSEAKARIAGSQGVISCAVSEAQPLVVIEAALLGVPILLSDIAAHRELKRFIPDILLFDSDSTNSFRKSFGRLRSHWRDKKLKERLKRDALNAFGMEVFCQNVSNLIHEIDSLSCVGDNMRQGIRSVILKRRNIRSSNSRGLRNIMRGLWRQIS